MTKEEILEKNFKLQSCLPLGAGQKTHILRAMEEYVQSRGGYSKTKDLDELWDKYSELIDEDIFSLQYFAGKIVMTSDNYKKFIKELSLPIQPVEESYCSCPACQCGKNGFIHLSDCAVHNEPAEPNGSCNCTPIQLSQPVKEVEEIRPSGTIHHCGNELTEKEIDYDHCLKCSEYLIED